MAINSISGGLGVTVPTAETTTVALSDGTPLLAVDNEAVHLQPFFGYIYAPSERLFSQGFLQWDFAANGNSVALNSTGTGLTQAGELTDANHIFADLVLVSAIGFIAMIAAVRPGLRASPRCSNCTIRGLSAMATWFRPVPRKLVTSQVT